MRAARNTQRAQVGEAPDALITTPDASRSVYDPAIMETTPFTGTEYALSAFDTVLASSITWQRNDRPQNVKEGLATAIFNPVFQENNANFQASLSKTNATGGTMTVSNTTFYDQTNTPTWQVPSTYAVTYQAAFNQPLMQGCGRDVQPHRRSVQPVHAHGDRLEHAGLRRRDARPDQRRHQLWPTSRGACETWCTTWRTLTGNFISPIGRWKPTKTGRDSALQTWQKIHALYTVGARGGEAEKEAQSQAQYYLFRGQVQTSLNDLFRSREPFALRDRPGRGRRPADPSGRRADHGRGALRLARSPLRGDRPQRGTTPPEVADQRAGTGNHRRQEPVATPLGRQRPVQLLRSGRPVDRRCESGRCRVADGRWPIRSTWSAATPIAACSAASSSSSSWA